MIALLRDINIQPVTMFWTSYGRGCHFPAQDSMEQKVHGWFSKINDYWREL